MSSINRSVPLLALLLLAVACGGSSEPTPPPPPAPVAARLAFTAAPTNVRTQAAFSTAPVVEVRDAAGNRVAGNSSTVTLRLAGGTTGAILRGTATASAENGFATFAGLSVDSAGVGYTIVASAAGLASATSSAFAVVRGTPQLAFRTQPVGGQAGVALMTQPIVEIRDSVTGGILTARQDSVTLTLAANAGGGALTGLVRVAAVAGVATFTGVAVSTAGTGYVLNAAGPGLMSAASAPFTVAAVTNTGLLSTQLAAGGFFNCAISSPDGAVCWGNNTRAELGIGESGGFRSRPLRVNSPVPLVRLAATGGTTNSGCGLTADGRAFCWGGNNRGQLGIGNTISATSPVEVRGGRTYKQIAIGGEHACAIAQNDAAFCWGANERGEIGNGTGGTNRPDVLEPVAVAGGRTFVRIAVGFMWSCALDTEGRAWCWGTNGDGQLGDGTTTIRNAPVAVQQPAGVRFTSIASSGSHSCALDAQEARAYCWGSNAFGQLGDGSTISRLTPTPVAGSLRFVSLAVGGPHSCGITEAGDATCWGSNASGQLGDDTLTPRITAGALVVGNRKWTQLVAGQFHTCGMEAVTARTFCWGSAASGILGNGTSGLLREARPQAVLSVMP